MIDRTSFRKCEDCGGNGFVARGEIPDRTFPLCKICKGMGQIYCAPETKPPPKKPKAPYDPVVF